MGSSEIAPLAQTLWSQEAEDFVSENDEILTVVGRVLEATQKRGILVFDRGRDRRLLYQRWVPDESIDFIIRQRGDRNLFYKSEPKETLQLATNCPTPYRAMVIREKEGKEEVCQIEFGFLPVRLPEHSARKLWLVVIKGFGQEPMIF